MILVAVGIFFALINPQYKKIKEMNATIAENSEMIQLATELRDQREKLQTKFNNIGVDDRDALRKILPDTVDNVRLVLDINNIASDQGILITNIGVEGDTAQSSESENATSRASITSDRTGASYGTITLSFSVSAEYDNFKQFLRRLENSLRLVDVTDFSVRAGTQSGLYSYSVKLNTYWLR